MGRCGWRRFLLLAPMFFTKNETSCSIRSLMRPFLWLVRVLAKRHQQPRIDLPLHNLSSHCFMPPPHSRCCPRTTCLNRVRSFRSSFSCAFWPFVLPFFFSLLLFFLVPLLLFIISFLFIYLYSFIHSFL
ncbi:hypothetical protein M413DRAFT_158708 [Hebeloma cylindrosporum]|uniref:Transmembrane protein n=1 Tax=Hebeloma cylindrosporum TaxID=76867 RepID=A0A0C2XTR7_HEBCY|nr:hypothetical protein M413DRAFT_158708 [Hebeloma cylindrosporum h7]